MNKPADVPTAHPAVEIKWVGGMQFEVGRASGQAVLLDGDAKSGPGPFDVLVGAIATCASTDVVTILQKQGVTLESLNVIIDSTRMGSPRRLASAALRFVVRGAKLTNAVAESAVTESIMKYCGVRASLIGSAQITWTVEVQ